MIPYETITSGSLNALLFYTACLGILLLIGTILRIKLKVFKKLVIPASLIAGILGLLLGPDVLGILPKEMISTWSGYAGILIAVVFAPMLIGIEVNMKRFKETQAVSQLIYGWTISFIQWGIPLLLMAVFFTPILGIDPLFGTLVEIGWSGGHGTAGGMVEAFESLNWSEGGSLGLTTATIGLVVGIIAGTIIINYGIRKGYTGYMSKKDVEIQPDNPDIIPRAGQGPSSVTTVRSEVIDGYALHLAIISVAIFIGWFLKGIIDNFIPGMPLFPLAMIGGFIVGLIIRRTSLKDAIDTKTFTRIQGFSLDFLVAAAVATISIPVVIDYFFPLLIMSVIMLFIMVFYFFYIGPRLFKNDWFEHSIIQFGTATGVAAIGYMLLRMVDPKLESDAFIAYGLRAPFSSPFAGGGLVTASIPILTISYGALSVGLTSILIALAILMTAKFTGIYKKHNNSYFS